MTMMSPTSTTLRVRGGGDAPSDLDLMEGIRRGESRALTELMSRYWAPLVRYSIHLLESPDGAEDIAQEVFVRVWQRRANWKPTGSLSAFVYRIARNLALKELRRRRVRETGAVRIGQESRPVATPCETAVHKELQAAVARAIEALPPRRREAFVLSRYHDHSLTEVAGIMGTSKQTVANQVGQAVAELRRALQVFQD